MNIVRIEDDAQEVKFDKDLVFENFSEALKFVHEVKESGWIRLNNLLYVYQEYDMTDYGILLTVTTH